MSVFQRGSTALITGGSSGIGFAVAELCLKHGMKVAIVDNNSKTLDLAKQNLKDGDVQTYQADVSKEEDWKELKEKVGSPDLLMLNAGIGARGTWGDGDYFSKVRVLRRSLVFEVGARGACPG
jgi:NAD(P)-dependent dehydrogenase (short-subunit alcohol dehydrogenase family)